MISAKGLTKRYGSQIAVDSVSLKVARGEIFGLLGPNATGKTTIIRMLCGIIEFDADRIRIDGKNVQDSKRNFGYVS
ncbi:MAG: ABC-2 type transport system ATP-binding protein [Arenicella sp.]|jgi:ABC-2 type transport system ATP-binding protein